MADIIVAVTFADLTEVSNIGATISNPGGTILRITPTFFGSPFFEYTGIIGYDIDPDLFTPYAEQYAKRIRMTWRVNSAGVLTPSSGETNVAVYQAASHGSRPSAPNEAPFFQQNWSQPDDLLFAPTITNGIVYEQDWETGDPVSNLGSASDWRVSFGVENSNENYTVDLLSLEFTFEADPELYWVNKRGTREAP